MSSLTTRISLPASPWHCVMLWSKGVSLFCGQFTCHIQMRELDRKESWALKNWCFQIVMLEKTLESPLDNEEIKTVNPKRKQLLNIHWKDWCWSWSSSTLATWCEELIPWKRPWWWERLKAKEGDGRGWDGCMVSSTQWTWAWENSGIQWRTEKPGVLQIMGSQRVRHDLATEQQQQQIKVEHTQALWTNNSTLLLLMLLSHFSRVRLATP